MESDFPVMTPIKLRFINFSFPIADKIYHPWLFRCDWNENDSEYTYFQSDPAWVAFHVMPHKSKYCAKIVDSFRIQYLMEAE